VISPGGFKQRLNLKNGTSAAVAVLAKKESVREMPKLIKVKIEVPMASSRLHVVEATARA
jgi:hypothetical protein